MIFIDTGAFVARHMPRDQFHSAAVKIWEQLPTSQEKLCTSSFVLDETITLLARRGGAKFAAARARHWYASEVLEILRPLPEDELAALDWLEKYSAQDLSYTDCVSFALMRRHKIKRVFGFDQHFVRAGFKWLG